MVLSLPAETVRELVVTNNLISYFGSSVGTTFASEGYNDVSVARFRQRYGSTRSGRWR